MSIGAVSTLDDLRAGAWFIFRHGKESGVGLKAIFKPELGAPKTHCIVIAPEPGFASIAGFTGLDLFAIPGAIAVPIVEPANFHVNEQFGPGILLVSGTRSFFVFASQGRYAFVDTVSGELLDEKPQPAGWFTRWRLLQNSPLGFEEVVRFGDQKKK